MSGKDIELSKKKAAEKATEYIQDGMVVGLGTGSTAEYFIKKLAEKKLDIIGVPTSKKTEKLAKELGMSTTSLEECDRVDVDVDVDVDGADEIDPEFNLIKGGGGAHTSEKNVADKAKKFIIIADYTKTVKKLGDFPVAVEVKPSEKKSVTEELKALGGIPKERKGFITNRNNIIIDTKFNIKNPEKLEKQLNLIYGIIENGIFARRKPEIVIIGQGDNVKTIKRKNGNT